MDQPAFQDSSGLAPLGMVFLLVMGSLTMALPRRFAVLPLLATVFYIPLGQQIIVGGLHFPMLRLLILLGFARVILRKETIGLSWNKIDKLFIWWAAVVVVLGTLAKPSGSILVNRLGYCFNAVGVYLLASCWVRDSRTFVNLVKILAVMAVPVAVLMVVEKSTSHNVFSVFGGVPATTSEREGHLRCQAAFRHPILAGTFGATLLPLFIGLWFQGKGAKKLALVGGASACAIGVAASSGGALLTMVMGGVGFGFWRLRQRMRLVRRSLLALMVVLTIVMNAPVWYLIARVSSITGGTGWHRAWLIDVALAHFGEWCVFGTTYTAHWGGEAQILDDDPDNIDITNQFVFEGVRGGIARLALFVAIIVQCFKALGRRIQVEAARSLEGGMQYWAIGVTLFTHCVAFWSVLYYDQLGVMWFWLLAVISRVVCDEEAHSAQLAGEVSVESGSRESPLATQDLVFQ